MPSPGLPRLRSRGIDPPAGWHCHYRPGQVKDLSSPRQNPSVFEIMVWAFGNIGSKIVPVFVLVKTLVAGRRQLQQPVILLRADVVVKIIDRIDGVAIAVDLIMTVGACALARASDPADDLPADDALAGFYIYAEHVPVQGSVAVTVVDHHMVTITVTRIAGHLNDAVGGSIDRRPLWSGKVKPGVEFSGLVNGVDPVAKA